MKTTSLRVQPEIAPALIAHIGNYSWRGINWDKPNHDDHTHFSASRMMMERVYAFIAGFKAGKEYADREQTKLMS